MPLGPPAERAGEVLSVLPAGHAASPPARLRTCGLQELGRREAQEGASGGVRPPAVPVGFPGLHPCGVVSAGRGAGQPGRGSRPKSRLGKAAELSPAVAGVKSSWPLLSTCPVLTQVAAAALGRPPWPHVPPLGHVLVTRAIGPGRRDTSECGRRRRGPPQGLPARGAASRTAESRVWEPRLSGTAGSEPSRLTSHARHEDMCRALPTVDASCAPPSLSRSPAGTGGCLCLVVS